MSKAKNSFSKFFSAFVDSLSIQEKINFARHLAIVVRVGLPIYEGLSIIKAQTESKALRGIIDHVMADVSNGKFLADSLGQYEYVFGEFFVNIVRVGESSGTLAQNLLYLAEELKRAKALRAKVRSAMVYPIVILIATVALTGFLTFFVFPKLLGVFSNLNVKLPATTQYLILIVEFLRQHGISILLGAIAGFIAFRFITKNVAAVKYVLNLLSFRVPVLGKLVIGVNMVNFTRVLALLLKSGVHIVEATNITADTFSNLVYKRALHEAATEVQKGGQLAAHLLRKKKFFPSLVTGMVRVGENTGTLEENLEYISQYYDEEVDNALHNLTSLLEPLLLLLMGGVVGFVAISIITPIYSISQGIK